MVLKLFLWYYTALHKHAESTVISHSTCKMHEKQITPKRNDISHIMSFSFSAFIKHGDLLFKPIMLQETVKEGVVLTS